MRSFYAALALACLSSPLMAQTNISLGAIEPDPDAPVEITADSLSVDQENGQATFSGEVLIVQGDLRISAGTVSVEYDDETGDIMHLLASGGVTFVTATDAVEAQEADYDLEGKSLDLTGDVLVTQGRSAISASAMTIDLSTGNAELTGRVRTTFVQGNN
ncbi:lipopolysaccharide transport periplasmic protein LptA [Marivivens donghaensis]